MRVLSIILILLAAAGCQSTASKHLASAGRPVQPAAAAPEHAPQYLLTGDVTGPGPRPRDLLGKETVSSALAELAAGMPKSPVTTAVLVRRCPEGTSRELIDLDATLHPVNPGQDYVLRDGDELILPSLPSAPAGLQRPRVLRVSAAN